ncbi:MAG: FKBP-type peptidyl-prolyl cis-trans isomerase [Euryarchaeota archaeon]|nr:FKBP-type peptidyl-prolyl cis-trans isomerase [Euryarchaeota archaeon]
MEQGTIIRLSYDMWLENVDGLFDTTDRDRASESGIYSPKQAYGPIVAIVGGGRLVPGLEKAIQEKGEVGEEVKVDLEPSEAYGERDPKKIEMVPMQRLKAAKVEPKVGNRVMYKNQPATITRTAGGRVWLDTNSPLAGRKVTYTFKVEEVVESPDAKVEALIELNYRRGLDFEVTIEDKAARVLVPDEAKYDQQWAVAKFRVAHDVGHYTDMETVRFVEEYKTAHDHTHEEGGEKEGAPATTSGESGSEESGKDKGATAAEGQGSRGESASGVTASAQ